MEIINEISQSADEADVINVVGPTVGETTHSEETDCNVGTTYARTASAASSRSSRSSRIDSMCF